MEVEDASVPQRPLALEMFPALQELRLEGIPLEYVEGERRVVHRFVPLSASTREARKLPQAAG